MEGLKLYTPADVMALTSTREGETKLGQMVQTISALEDLGRCTAPYVVLGIPEDYGIRANYGIAGAATAWDAALKVLLNLQSNLFLSGTEILLLGHFEINAPLEDDLPSLFIKVEEIDNMVFPVMQQIFAAGKVPIVIGGGHNNAYPIIKGLSLALEKAVDVVNIDAHADLRSTNGRHSGNAFSYALKDGYLKSYGVYGLQENYNNATVLKQIETSSNISCIYFDELVKTKDHTMIWSDFNKPFDYRMGLEIDLDCIQHVLASAGTPSGFSLNDMRRIVLNTKKNLAYLHLCEGAAQMSDGRQDPNTAKTIAYLATDFIKAQLNT